jgi:hypothetical protein
MAYFARVVFNSINWQLPSGPAGKCKGANNWECTCGFGFEEWYRNERFQKIDDEGIVWQYGYLQCFKNLTSHQAGVYPDFTLFAKQCKGLCAKNATGEWWTVAHYKNIVVLDEAERSQARLDFALPLQTMRTALNNLGVDVVKCFDGQPLSNVTNGVVRPKLNIRFQLSDEDYLFDKKLSFKHSKNWYRYKSLYNQT